MGMISMKLNRVRKSIVDNTRSVVDYMNIMVTVAVGLYFLLLSLPGFDGFKELTYAIRADWLYRLLFLAVGGGLAGLNFHVLREEWKLGGLRRNVRITNDHGIVELSTSALEKDVLRDLRLQPDILEPDVLITPRDEGKPLLCEVALKLHCNEEAIKQSDAIKKRPDAIKQIVRECIDRRTPGGLTIEVMVEVRDFVYDSTRLNGRRGNERGEFNGPVYATDMSSGSDNSV